MKEIVLPIWIIFGVVDTEKWSKHLKVMDPSLGITQIVSIPIPLMGQGRE